jgi:hypothetical protein
MERNVYHVRKVATQGGSMAVRVLLMLTAFAVLYGCGQASSPPERQEKQVGVEEAKPKEPKEPTEQAGASIFSGTYKCEDFSSREAAQEYLDTHATEDDRKVVDPDDNGKACDEKAYRFAPRVAASAPASASVLAGTIGEEWAEGSCRVETYASEENMNQQEANAFSERVVDEVAEKVNDDPSLTVGPAQNAVLDDLGVPRYPECVGGEE